MEDSENVKLRRRWASEGLLPPEYTENFTQGEAAVLNKIIYNAKSGKYNFTLKEIGVEVGVGLTTVREAIRKARDIGLMPDTANPANGRP